MTQKLDKINKPHNGIGSRPKLEPWHKQAQSPTNIKTKQVARTKWDVYKIYLQDRVRRHSILFKLLWAFLFNLI